MPSVSQTVPNYVLGISEQPDQLKLPGQVTDLVNAYPDVTSGLVKRPGTHLLGDMANAQDNGKWFDIYRDDVEQYVVQVATGGQVRVWRLVDLNNDDQAGDEVTVDFAGTTDDHYDYLIHTNPDNIQALTVNDVTFILNRGEDTAMAATTSPAAVNEAFVDLLQIAYNKTYKFDLLDASGTVIQSCDSALTSADTSGEVEASTILSELRTDANGTHSGITFTATVVGNGLYISADAAFGISTSEAQLVNVFTNQIEDVSRLPYQCHHGYKVQITNSQSADDDYWLEFQGNNDADGEGHWEESVAPGIRTTIDNTTMPVQLVRQADGTFQVSRIDWAVRDVGDDNTVPRASFLPPLEDDGTEGDGRRINKMLFFRNRLCLLSNENIVMSRPGQFFNFWANTALTASPVDPIDLSAASTTPAVLFDGIEVNTGLILFSRTQQFMLVTDADVLTSETAKINVLSSYEFDVDTRPIPIGSTVGFVNDTGTFSRFFEMTGITREGEPEILEQSKVISTLFPSGLMSIGDSRENSLVLFASDTLSPTLWCYKYFNRGDSRVQSAWFKWTMSGDVVHVCIFRDNVFFVIRNEEPDSDPVTHDYTLHRLNLQETEATVPVEDTTKAIKIFLDHKTTVAAGDITFDTNTRKSTFARPMLPYGTFVVYTLEDGNNTGNAVYPTVDGTNLVVDGDWSDTDLIVGFEYEMSVKMPNIYYTYQEGDSYRSDVHASLVIHRVKLDFGPVGVYDVTLKRKGRDDYTKNYSSVLVDQYELDDTQIALTRQQSIPVYDRNINCTIELSSKHPSPTSLYGMSWEGDMSERFYRRA